MADTTGLSGYALYYAQAINRGMNDEEASRYATQQMGGSGLYRQDIDKILTGTGATSQSQNIRYDPVTGYAINKYSSGNNNTSGGSTYNDVASEFSSFFNKLTDNIPTFTPPTEAEMQGWAKAYADTSVNPLISAIQAALNKQLTSQETAKADVEAAYAGLPEKYQSQLNEARNYALENAIARGMGRSGVVNWETEKRTTPIMQEQAQAEREKAAKLASIANAIAAAESSAAEQTQSAEAQRAALEAAKMGELQQWAAAMANSSGQNAFNQALSLAGLYNQNQASNTNLLLQLLPLFLGG